MRHVRAVLAALDARDYGVSETERAALAGHSLDAHRGVSTGAYRQNLGPAGRRVNNGPPDSPPEPRRSGTDKTVDTPRASVGTAESSQTRLPKDNDAVSEHAEATATPYGMLPPVKWGESALLRTRRNGTTQMLLGLVAPKRTASQAKAQAEIIRRGGPYEVQGKRWKGR